MASAGEFSARAFFNGKMDLTEAEGIAATINAATEMELRAAASLREGNLHREIEKVTQRVAHWLAMVEAGIDFSEEEGILSADQDEMQSDLAQIADFGLGWWLEHAVRMDRLDTLPTVVFIGEPNVGKSSLINALAGTTRSITSEVAGTTRDVLGVVMKTSRGDMRLLDVPGKEEPVDELRRQMMKARENALLEADLAIEVVVDEKYAISGMMPRHEHGTEIYAVQNKADLLPPTELRTFEYIESQEEWGGGGFMTIRGDFQLVSAKTGLNIEKLREEIGELVYRRRVIHAHLPVLNQRHRLLVLEVKEAIDRAVNLMDRPELLASELRRALDSLGQITGVVSPDEILGRIFSTFCIGK